MSWLPKPPFGGRNEKMADTDARLDQPATMQIVAAILAAGMLNPSQVREQHKYAVELYLKTLQDLGRRTGMNPVEWVVSAQKKQNGRRKPPAPN